MKNPPRKASYDPVRGVRLKDDIWEKLSKEAKAKMTSPSVIIRQLIEKHYADKK